MEKISVWSDTAPTTSFPQLNGDLTVDVVIIGGGITGITAADILSRAGRRVAVLEARTIADGSTGYSTGNLYAVVGSEGLHKVQSKWNEDVLRQVVTSRAAAVDFIEDKVREYRIDCDFRRVPWSLFTYNDKQRSYIRKEKEAAEKAGLSFGVNAFPPSAPEGFTLDGQAQFNPFAYTVGLAKSIASDRCLLFERSKVVEINDEACVVKTTLGSVTASAIIMATHTPKGIYKVHSSLGPYREYAVAATLNSPYPPPGIFWQLMEKEHYSMRTYDTPGGPVLMVLGESHKVGQKEANTECFRRLEAFLREHFDVASVAYQWGAQQYKPADGIPYIGKSSGRSNIYIATGFAADGLTYGTLAARIISDEILGVDNPWRKTYDASRTTHLASAGKFIKENLNVLGQYLKDIPGAVDAKDLNEVGSGEGKVMQHKGEKLAVYRDTAHQLHVCSAVCTHMDCIVHWNRAERSWDCPCHGSRFTVDGEVIEGPAIYNLPPRDIKQE